MSVGKMMITRTDSGAVARQLVSPGLIRDLDIDDYHGGPGISKTGLDHIARSPATFYGLHLDPRRPAPESKSGQLEGSLAHCATLEPSTFSQRYWVGPTVSRNTKVWKEFVETLPPGVIAIQQEQRDVAFMQADRIRSLPEVREAFLNGWAEESAYWVDEATGMLCRVRPDFVYDCGAEGVVLFDVKTFTDASPDEFKRQVPRKRYHVQRSWYGDGYEIASGRNVLAFVFVVVETTWPFLASAIMIDEAAYQQGRLEYRRDLETYARCRESGSWPGYGNNIQTIALPRWSID